MMKCILAFAVLLAGTTFRASAMPEKASENRPESIKVEITEGQIDVISGIIYSQVISTRSNRALRMTVLVPRTRTPKPAIVYFPGGGFTSADYEKFIEMRMALAKAGFVVAAAEYRTVPDKFPALVIDGKAAVRFLRAHAAQFGIDPTRIGVIGDSAGGYLSQMVGTTNGEKEFDQGDYLDQSSDVQAAVTIYGISNLLNIGEGYSDAIQQVHASPAVTEALLVHGPAFADFAGASILSDPEKAMKASPLGHVKEHMPPFLIMHGSNDRLVSPVQSEQLFKALTEKGNQATYVTVEGAGHGDLYWFQQPVIERVVSWFQTVFQYHTDK
ncbi:alpha/beta hydrolase [Bacteroides mediterraneensis]|uniref:alpha/beta hydrolase n=1 Tax=Bacteroides mediterraneensis TaxID=1841856 RepID=UPI0009FA86E7|nr:alpha/beta hydrolase [Bacteroides mediterraneensis]